MNNNIFYFRHPEPINHKGLCYGQTDIDVSESKIIKASALLNNFIDPDLTIYSSPLKRCAKVAEKLKTKIYYSDQLKEISFGIYDGSNWNQIPKQELDLWAQDISGYKFKNGENYYDLKNRIREFIGSIPKNQKTLLITHSGVIRACFDILYGINIKESINFTIPYSEIITNIESITSKKSKPHFV